MFAKPALLLLVASPFLIATVLVRAENAPKVKPPYCYSKQEQKQTIFVAWNCDAASGRCLRVRTDENGHNERCLTSLNVCNLLCDQHASLWPLPTGNVFVQKDLLTIYYGSIFFVTPSGISEKLQLRFKALRDYFTGVIGYYDYEPNIIKDSSVAMKIKFLLQDNNATALTYETRENYHLGVQQDDDGVLQVTIEADTYFGARHGIETLLQLIVYDEISASLLAPSRVDITDTPYYKHRGILLDTSRNYYPVKAIKRLLDGMAYNKMNVFHWHIADTQSFPFLSKHYPQMTAYGAYSQKQVYTWSDIRDVVEYAAVRGVKVVPELDIPTHVGEGWQQFSEDVLLCFKAEPWSRYHTQPPYGGILNPVSERVYEILRNLFSEFNELFISDTFHMGGNQVTFPCWNQTDSVLKWLSDRHLSRRDEDSFVQLWGEFHNRSTREFDAVVRTDPKPKIVLWTSTLTMSKAVKRILDPKRYIIQVWTYGYDRHIADLLNHGYHIIMTNYDELYLDCGFGAWIGDGNNWCSPYKGWQKVYSHDPLRLVRKLNDARLSENAYRSLILGSEAALWSEQSDQHNMDSRLWPRAAALAERLWSNPSTQWKEAERRMLTQRERMTARNIGSDVIEPLWCHQNEDLCY